MKTQEIYDFGHTLCVDLSKTMNPMQETITNVKQKTEETKMLGKKLYLSMREVSPAKKSIALVH